MSYKRKDSHPAKNVSAEQPSAEEADELGNVAWTRNGMGNQSPSEVASSSDTAAVRGDDASSSGARDEDEDDDDEAAADERRDGMPPIDPEKLKAFNMFVRLFVDENLDRTLPISKQPKDKVQAIVDSCARQFPEYATAARKRIRTYLKSCRRTKRGREQAGLDALDCRPTPPHLTSVHAEQLLARACENEAENAKRMRMGLEPLSQPLTLTTQTSLTVTPHPARDLCDGSTAVDASLLVTNVSSSTSHAAPGPVVAGSSPAASPFQQQQQSATSAAPAERLASLLRAASRRQLPATVVTAPANNSGLSLNNVTPASLPLFSVATTPVFSMTDAVTSFRPSFVTAPPAVVASPTVLVNGERLATPSPQDRDMKKSPLLNHKLNSTEMSAVRQLVTGYRESAAFLLRSADELDHLLQIQPKL